MVRTPAPKIGRPTPIQPVAQPVSTYVRPAEPARSSLHQLAEGLAAFDSGMRGWLDKKEAEQAEADAIRGEAAFNRSNQVGWAEGVRSGAIPAHASPIFMEAYKKAQGEALGVRMREQFNLEYAQWEGRNSNDPEEFTNFLDGFVTRHYGAEDDPDILAGFNPHVEALRETAYTTWSTDRANTIYSGHLDTRAALVGVIIDNASQQGIALETGTDYDAMRQDILAQRQEALGSGIRMADYDKELVATIAAKAIEHGDPELLQLLEDTLPGYEVALSSLPDFRDVKATTEATLITRYRQAQEADAKRQQAEDKARENAIVTGVMREVAEDPSVEIPEEVLREWEKYDPEARKKLVDARKSLSDGLTMEDPQDLLTIERHIQAGATLEDIFELAANGVIKDPATFKSLIDRVQQRQEAGAQILTTQTAKRYLSTIKERTANLAPDAAFAPDGLTDEGIEATKYFEEMLIDWRMANPEATLFEQDQFTKQAAEQVLERIVGDDGETPQFISPADEEALRAEEAALAEQEAAQREAVAREAAAAAKLAGATEQEIGAEVGRKFGSMVAPPAPDEETIQLYGQEAPPSLSSMDATARQLIEQQAEVMGITADEYSETIWRTVRESLGLNAKTPQEVVDGFNYSSAPGMVEPGTIDIDRRQVVRNSDGSIGTELSTSFEEDGVEVLIPTIFNGEHHSPEEAIQHYKETGEHLGKFSSPEEADAFAKALHDRQDAYYNSLGNPGASRQSQANPDIFGFVEPTTNPEVRPEVIQKFANRRLPVSIRNNNMGAVSIVGEIDGSWAARQPGFVGTSPRPAAEGGYYAKYATPEHGVAAASRLLERYGQQGVNTPLAIVTKWSEDRTAHNAYAATLVRYLKEAGFNVGRSTTLDLSDPKVRLAILKAKSHHEAGAGMPVYADAVFERGVNYQFS